MFNLLSIIVIMIIILFVVCIINSIIIAFVAMSLKCAVRRK